MAPFLLQKNVSFYNTNNFNPILTGCKESGESKWAPSENFKERKVDDTSSFFVIYNNEMEILGLKFNL